MNGKLFRNKQQELIEKQIGPTQAIRIFIYFFTMSTCYANMKTVFGKFQLFQPGIHFPPVSGYMAHFEFKLSQYLIFPSYFHRKNVCPTSISEHSIFRRPFWTPSLKSAGQY